MQYNFHNIHRKEEELKLKMEEKELFRKESIEHVYSTENLNDFLSAVNPFDWAVLASVLLLLTGLSVWSFVGNIERNVTVNAEVSNGIAHFTTERDALKSGMPVKIGDTESSVRDTGLNVQGKYIGAANVKGMADVIYSADITVEHLRPIDFLFN
ncbi:MAG: hypothetical protein IJU07_02625 [Synergistaceae bacterium]|nr:hypothetical protein [Synergistaceae bacterium]